MTNIKSCLLCKNYNTHPCECEHCEDWDNFRISESGKALREKIYGDGYQDGHRDGYDKGYDDAQANNNRPQSEWIIYDVDITPHPLHCKNCGWSHHHIKNEYIKEFKVCPNCGAIMQNTDKEP